MGMESAVVLKIENELQSQEVNNLKAQNEERKTGVDLLNQQIEAYKNLLELEKAGRQQDKEVAAAELKEAKKTPWLKMATSFGVGYFLGIVTVIVLVL